MTRTIICATDFSAAAEHAAQLAARLARLFGDRLRLVHRVPRSPFIHPELVGTALGPLEEAARAAMGVERDRLASIGVEVEEDLAIGPLEDHLLELAATPSTRLLALGTRGRNGVARALPGSLAERVARRAACPVLVVPARLARQTTWAPPRPLRLTMAVDLSPATDAALDWVKGLAAVVPCRIELVHTYWPLRETQRLGLPWPGPEVDNELEIQEVLDRELRVRVERIWGSCRVPLHLRPGLGPRIETLAAEADSEEADLLVVGTSQHRLGSVGVGTLHASRVPVLCVPERLGATAVKRPELTAPRTLLVPTDLSELGNAAVPHACRLLGAGGGKLVLCYASEAPDRDPRLEDVEKLRHDLLALVPAEAAPMGIRARTLVQESGPPAVAIVQAAQRLGCDGIVMSSHARSGLARALLGSVAEAVLRDSTVPVTVVPARAAEALVEAAP